MSVGVNEASGILTVEDQSMGELVENKIVHEIVNWSVVIVSVVNELGSVSDSIQITFKAYKRPEEQDHRWTISIRISNLCFFSCKI